MKYFIDTNLIIDLLENKEETIEHIKIIASEADSKLFINRLITLEALRTIHFTHTKKFKEAEEVLKSFEKLDIKQAVYDEAISFSRFCHKKGIKLKGKCEAIDFLHFITAKYYELALISNDRDFEKLDTVYPEFKGEDI